MLGDMPELAQYYKFDWQLVGNLAWICLSARSRRRSD
jgi:hypothetical protein